MALNTIDRLTLLHQAKQDFTQLRAYTARALQLLIERAPGDIDAQANGAYGPVITACDTALAQIATALNNVTVTAADKTAYADAAIAAAKS